MQTLLKDKTDITEGYSGKRVHVLGIGRSGLGGARLLHEMGARVSMSDISSPDKLGRFIDDVPDGTTVYTGTQDMKLLDGVDRLILSPGVPKSSDIVKRALGSIEVMSEIELSYDVAGRLSDTYGFDLKWYGVTGTNGKSTTVTLLYEMLKAGGFNASLNGNIGEPLSEKVLDLLLSAKRGDTADRTDIVVELSSFQLELMNRMKLDISALLNITEDHLDRYRDMHDYASAKAAIFNRQGRSDAAVINADDPLCIEWSKACGAEKYYLSTGKKVRGIFLNKDIVQIMLNDEAENLCGSGEIRIKGLHNLYNSMSAALMACLAGVPQSVAASVMSSFPGLEHRLEHVAEMRGINIYNDSKGTNVGAVIKSLESFDKGVILIAGGRDKNSDFSVLAPYIKGRVKRLVLIGEAAQKMKDALGEVAPVSLAGSLEEAVGMAIDAAEPGNTVLFSPACASFDMFLDYEDRGRQFKLIVNGIIER